ncbi:cysteine desulfurase [Candidatus Saccharibacteria bacterium]|nr:cysteine desulfurase [Candidatus Saccharibacteria bacterium]
MDNQEIIYLDHAAATPMDGRVLSDMQPYFCDLFFNPSSPYAPAVGVRKSYEEARHRLASAIGAKPSEIILTAGATESINLAFTSVDHGHAVTSNIEHASVLECAKQHDHTLVSADKYGYISAQAIKQAIKPDTQLVSISLANNELGTIQPIREIAEIVKNERLRRLQNSVNTPIYFHCDASQGVGQIDVNVSRLGIDMLTLNAGKIYGPKHVGLLWVSSHVELRPLIVGGGQERNLRSGTENVSGVIGFAKALELVCDKRTFETKRLEGLRDYLQSKFVQAFPDMIVSGHPKYRLSGHLHVSFPGLDGERLVFLLENRGVLITTGSACAANKNTRSHVLTAIGLQDFEADGSIRITLGHLSNENNVKRAAEIIIEVVRQEYERVAR